MSLKPLLVCVNCFCLSPWLLLLAAVLKPLCLQPLVLQLLLLLLQLLLRLVLTLKLLWALKLLVAVSAFLVLVLGPFLTGFPIVLFLLFASS
jgi:hypothetical protein